MVRFLPIVVIAAVCVGCRAADESPPPTAPATSCEEVENIIEQIECFATVAAEAKDPAECDRAQSEDVIYQCYAIVAERLENAGVCDRIPTPTLDHRQLKDACISDVAKKTLDHELCGRVIFTGLRESCYAAIGSQTGNTVLCDEIRDPGLRSLCSGEPSLVDTSRAEPPVPGLGAALNAALAAFNPRFKAWSTADYSPTVQADAAGRGRQPSRLDLDVNLDGIPDVIVDGHDDRRSLLLGLVSGPDGHDVTVIRESLPMAPRKVRSWNNGVMESGLNYHLWAHGNGTGFTFAHPQQTDAEGNLVNDGIVIDYTFAGGTFTETAQIP